MGVSRATGSKEDLMKKGLRHLGGIYRFVIVMFQRRPDEEGIKTRWGGHRPLPVRFQRRPDEEGIKTLANFLTNATSLCSKEDLMKKGLRLERLTVTDVPHFVPKKT